MSASKDEVIRPRMWIRTSTFSDGTTVEFRQGDIVVLVGPNNVGKSVALRNIEDKTKDKKSSGLVITNLEIPTEGDSDSVITWLNSTCKKNIHSPSNPTYTLMGASVGESQAKHWWAHQERGLGELSGFFVYHLTTEARLGAANPASNIPLTRQPFTHPIHYLQADERTEARVSDYFKKAFGQDLIVHRNAGNEVPLYCGDKPVPGPTEDRLSFAYQQQLEKLPTLHSQGDGMRAFVGVLLHTMVVDHAVVLIDEPEAFLHPPQARLLSQMLVRESSADRQLFVATHSGDIIRGLLDSKTERVRIVRIQRDGNINRIRELDNEGIKKIWGDPLLRHSNVLDGLFHEKVVICESDSDCRFYAAVLDALFENRRDIPKPDFMFTHCGGKDRMPVVIQSLYKLGVPVIVISDFDVLNNERPLREIYESLGGNWDEVSDKWGLVKSSVEEKKPELSSEDVKKEITDVLSQIKDTVFPDSGRNSIAKILKQSSPWSIAKGVGRNYVPSGDPTQACNHLFDKFGEKGLFVLEVGELEGFARSVGSHGPRWVNAVLTKDLLNDPELDAARQFVNSFASKS